MKGEAMIQEVTKVATPNCAAESTSASQSRTVDSLAANSLVICHCPPTLAAGTATLSLADAAFSGTTWGALQFEQPTSLLAVCCTPLPGARVLDEMVPNAPKNLKPHWYQSLCPSGVAEVPLLNAMGLAQLQRMVISRYKASAEMPSLLLIEMRMSSHDMQKNQSGFVQLTDALSRTGAAVILIVQGGDPAWLSNVVPSADMLFVDVCEPDGDAMLAFKIRPKPLTSLWIARPDPMMMSFLRDSAQPRWRHEPFLADDPLSRKLLRMRKSNMTLDQIGADLGLDKSTIQRRLSKLGVIKHKPDE